jgi:hypothetical protein
MADEFKADAPVLHVPASAPVLPLLPSSKSIAFIVKLVALAIDHHERRTAVVVDEELRRAPAMAPTAPTVPSAPTTATVATGLKADGIDVFYGINPPRATKLTKDAIEHYSFAADIVHPYVGKDTGECDARLL